LKVGLEEGGLFIGIFSAYTLSQSWMRGRKVLFFHGVDRGKTIEPENKGFFGGN
jgi:hypothetical protein